MTVLYRYALDPSSSRIRIVRYSRPDDCGKDKSGRFERGNICGGVREGRERTLSAERTRRTVEKARGLKTQKLQAERFGPVASSKPRAIKLRPKDQLTKAAAEQERRAILAREHANKVRKEADFTFWEPNAENLERRHAEILKADQGAKTQREMADRALEAIAKARRNRKPEATSESGKPTSTSRPDVSALRKAIQRDTHSVQDVINGTHPVGVEGRGGKDLLEARKAGLFTTQVGSVGIFARDQLAAQPVIDYLAHSGKYGTTEFSRLLGYSDEQINKYNEFLRLSGQGHLARGISKPPTPTPQVATALQTANPPPPPAPVATAPAVATVAQTPQPQPQPQPRTRAPRRTHLERLQSEYTKLHDDYHAAFVRSRTATTDRGADAAKEKMAQISRRIREIREQIDELAPNPEGRSWSARHGAYWTGD